MPLLFIGIINFSTLFALPKYNYLHFIHENNDCHSKSVRCRCVISLLIDT